MLAPRSASAKHSAIPGKSHGIRNLHGSPNFSGNFLRRIAEQCLFNGVRAISLNFSLFPIKDLRVEANLGKRIKASAKLISKLISLKIWLKNPPLKHLVFEEPEFGKKELGKLEVGKPRVDKQEREENQEVKFDLTSSEDDSCKNEHLHMLHNFPRLLSWEQEIGFDFFFVKK
nr:hypothetical protein [Tanacetum cinerariifolium]